MRQFPHLQDTSFPDLSTVDVYRFKNVFDYTRWNENTKVRLVNVLFNSDYSDVIKFEDNSKRDNYFDNIRNGFTINLTTAARIVPENYVKLPIPYDVAAQFNYLYIDLPIATSEQTPLDYETDDGKRRWYFFIDRVSYLAPNTTQVFISLDVWTNFINDVEINYMMLERGHAPVSASDTEEYLSNPIENNRYLLAPDVNFDNAAITRHSDYVPFGNGKKYVCIASTCAPEQITYMGYVSENASYNPFSGISYSDIDARYGHQLQVNGLTIGSGKDFSNARTPAKAATSNNGLIPNNLTVYAIEASECYGNGTFFNDVISKCPQFLNTVKACFVVDENCITLGDTYSIAGHRIFACIGTKRNLFTKKLAESDFNYPTEYRRFAKLYTSPYAVLECTDNDGTTFTINIEETSTVQVKSVVSVAFPYIDYRVFLDGIGGIGSSSYSWRDLRNENHDLNISNSDWFKYCFDWEIPTFALYMDGETAYQLSAFNRNIKNAIRNAVVAYHNSMRSANTGMQNAIDAANTALTNVQNSTQTALTNANRSADTGKVNADNVADTGKANADNSADTQKANADASADTAYANLVNAINTEEANRVISAAYRLANVQAANDTGMSITQDANQMSQAKTSNDEALSFGTVGTEGVASTAIAMNNAISSVGTGILGGSANGMQWGGPTGAIAGGITGAVTSGLDATMNMSNNSVALNMKYEQADHVANHNHMATDIDTGLAERTQGKKNNLALQQLDNNINSEKEQMDNTHAMQDTNGQNTRNTTKANASRSQNTAKTNASNTQETSKTNASNTQATSKQNASDTFNNDRANAQRTRDVTVANAQFTREVGELNAKELLENAANTGMASLLDAKNNQPIVIGESSGNPRADYMETRGIQIKVKTQSDSAIRQTGDIFARYGYALNQVWDVAKSGLCLMNNFTYWKASDIWVDDKKSSNNLIQTIIGKIFNAGVTIWNNPEKIGRVSIYDN